MSAHYIEVTVQQGGGGFMRHASRTPVGNATMGHFYGVTACNRRIRPLRHDAPPREFTSKEANPKPTWNGGRMNRYCTACIAAVAARESADPVQSDSSSVDHENGSSR